MRLLQGLICDRLKIAETELELLSEANRIILLLGHFTDSFLCLLKFVDNEVLDLLHKEGELNLKLLYLLAINSRVGVRKALTRKQQMN